MYLLHKRLQDESGSTLVELLAAIAILSIIVTAFLAFFVQAGRTNNRTDQVNEATYIAQAEMENVMKYNQSADLFLKDYEDNNPTTTDSKGFDLNTVIEKKNIDKNGPQLYNVKVIVKQGADTLAQMETWIPLKDEEKQNNEQ